ncbi:MAG: hypothetical protein COT71_04345 [Candidatus Andersenbacteria bacterium CG10_big_fil_rev_8_21_14_0_10_54_11]|uniref:Glycosyltransferase subfamily 4-like N-terminal domain-containing protein n=1 Tax=Candidatus Andersenbacteria bacterium CG10_big_fil_rev_8_21_14_0_10_54_11 TaxID=1974485 RepID=A0A2M6WY86_9BACT|nr:MAG: hypothetical protein COT71_04345 [Candidatus Andersenbacteria bacterium CG10_big_fil_rev_8_21_14_0_10_54_11]
MRIGIDAHIILKEHKRYNPKIARYTEQLITHLLQADKKHEHTWVLFFDERMKGSRKLKQFAGPNVEIKHFPFVQYRRYLPVFYSHMLISSFLTGARLQVFHSPEGLIPYLYPGKIVTTFHYVPTGKSESNLFVRTFMLGARIAFAQLCKRARRIIVNTLEDKESLVKLHGCPAAQVVVMEQDDLERVDWTARTGELLRLYRQVAAGTAKRTTASRARAAVRGTSRRRGRQ